jgi:hypothetical protein
VWRSTRPGATRRPLASFSDALESLVGKAAAPEPTAEQSEPDDEKYANAMSDPNLAGAGDSDQQPNRRQAGKHEEQDGAEPVGLRRAGTSFRVLPLD